MKDEEWRDIKGFEGYYQVSSRGRVRSVTRLVVFRTGAKRTYPGGLLKGSGIRYPLVFLHRDGKGTPRTVHSLVAEAFLPNPEGHPLVRHLNDVPDDNRVENLAWGTDSDNRNDAVRNGVDYWTSRTHCKWGHEFTPENTRIERNGSRTCKQCDRERGARYRKRRSIKDGEIPASTKGAQV